MTIGKFTIKTFLILAVVCGIGISSAIAKDWSGIYTFDEESFEPDGSRISYWFRLEVTDARGKLTAILSNGTNGKSTRRLQLTVAGGPTRAQFYYDQCLPLIEGQSEACFDEFKPGDQMFALEDVPVHCEYELDTVWQKLNLAQQTESASRDSRSVFFRRVLG